MVGGRSGCSAMRWTSSRMMRSTTHAGGRHSPIVDYVLKGVPGCPQVRLRFLPNENAKVRLLLGRLRLLDARSLTRDGLNIDHNIEAIGGRRVRHIQIEILIGHSDSRPNDPRLWAFADQNRHELANFPGRSVKSDDEEGFDGIICNRRIDLTASSRERQPTQPRLIEHVDFSSSVTAQTR